MATNLIAVNVYQIAPATRSGNGQQIFPANVNPTYIPSQGLVVNPVTTGATNPIPQTGVYVYSAILMPNGDTYYSGLTAAAVAALANA